MLAVVSQHFQGVNILKFSDDGTYLLSGGDDARVLVWRFSRLVMLLSPVLHYNFDICLCLN